MWFQIRRCAIYFALLFALTACADTEIARNLTSKQSVEMLVILQRHGVDARRVLESSGRRDFYSVVISPAASSRALEVIHEYGLPRETDARLEALTESSGLTPPSPELIALKRDFALALMLERQIEALPSVVDAKVALRLQNFTGSGLFQSSSNEPSVSAVIRLDEEASALQISEEVKQLAAQLLPEVPAERANFSFSTTGFNAEAPYLSQGFSQLRPFHFSVPDSEAVLAKRQVLAALLGAAVLGIMLCVGIVMYMRSRRDSESTNNLPQTLS